MTDTPPRLLVIGAHPDDCEVKAGGLASLYVDAGFSVCFVSLTNGATGHHEVGGIELALRRQQEAAAVAETAGIDYNVLDNHTGELEPSVHNRKEVIRLIRNWQPDLILTHRPWDYHPDHRYTGMLVQDASYILTVPNMTPLTPHMLRMPVIMYLSDTFLKPLPLAPDVIIDIDTVLDRKLDMMHCHTSQMYEWLPYNRGELDAVPADEAGRRQYLRQWRTKYDAGIADRYRPQLRKLYGATHGDAVVHAEAFETCEYGSQLTDENRRRLFPFIEA